MVFKRALQVAAPTTTLLFLCYARRKRRCTPLFEHLMLPSSHTSRVIFKERPESDAFRVPAAERAGQARRDKETAARRRAAALGTSSDPGGYSKRTHSRVRSAGLSSPFGSGKDPGRVTPVHSICSHSRLQATSSPDCPEADRVRCCAQRPFRFENTRTCWRLRLTRFVEVPRIRIRSPSRSSSS